MWAEQRGRCAYCLWVMRHPDDRANWLPEAGGPDQLPLDATEDHRHPRGLGGLNTRVNLCLACYSCNQRKKARTAEEFEVSHAAWLSDRRHVAFDDADVALDFITKIHRKLNNGLNTDLTPKIVHGGFAEAQPA
jgi:hypothetical protein